MLGLTQLSIQNKKCGITLQGNPDMGPYRLEDHDQHPGQSNEYMCLLQKLHELCPYIKYLSFPSLHSNQLPLLQEAIENLPHLAHLYIGEVKVIVL